MTNRQDLVEDFWEDLGADKRYYTKPQEYAPDCWEMDVTDSQYMFDIVFWRTFRNYPFEVEVSSANSDNATLRFTIVDESADGTTLSEYMGDS